MAEKIQPMIHKYIMKGLYMLLDVNSGIVNVIDKLAYDVLDTYKGNNKEAVYTALEGRYTRDELTETMDELDELIKAEMLFAPMCESFKVVADEKPVVKSLSLIHI